MAVRRLLWDLKPGRKMRNIVIIRDKCNREMSTSFSRKAKRTRKDDLHFHGNVGLQGKTFLPSMAAREQVQGQEPLATGSERRHDLLVFAVENDYYDHNSRVGGGGL